MESSAIPPASAIPTAAEMVQTEARTLLLQAHAPVEAGEEVMAAGLLILPDLSQQIVMMPFANEAEKQGCAAAFRERCQRSRAIAAVFLADSWYATGPDPDDPDGSRFHPGRPAGARPDRVECLIANCYLPETVIWIRQKYWRGPTTITWGEIEVCPLDDEAVVTIDRFDPFPRSGRAPEPDLDEVALQHGLGVRLVPVVPGEPVDLEGGESLTNPAALMLSELLRGIRDGLLANESDFPGQEPWKA